jgi:hypothetical protein
VRRVGQPPISASGDESATRAPALLIPRRRTSAAEA